MALDQKELNGMKPEVDENIRTASEASFPGRETLPHREGATQEAGGASDRGAMPGGERPPQPDLRHPQPAYSQANDPAYQAYKKIEKVLEEDLGEIFNNLAPKDQQVFKIKGEETARSIFQLVYHKTKIKVKSIIKLIKAWLKNVPGINKFFLEQEAKIKADKIIALASEDKKIEF